MPDLSFRVESARPVEFAASPMIAFSLEVRNSDPEELIHSVALRAQVQLEVTRRQYSQDEQERLLDLFGEPSRWAHTLRSMLWANVGMTVPPFHKSTVVDLQVPCTFDFNVAATKYFDGLAQGEVPLCFLFSGTIFHSGEKGLKAAPIPWSKEALYRMPVSVWKEMMDAYYPNTAWLGLRRDVFDRLNRYKTRAGLPTWEMALERLLDEKAAAMSGAGAR
ncbi:MAG TPA: DUF6084 family protein [Bryobacteraceae bacterium]